MHLLHHYEESGKQNSASTSKLIILTSGQQLWARPLPPRLRLEVPAEFHQQLTLGFPPVSLFLPRFRTGFGGRYFGNEEDGLFVHYHHGRLDERKRDYITVRSRQVRHLAEYNTLLTVKSFIETHRAEGFP